MRLRRRAPAGRRATACRVPLVALVLALGLVVRPLAAPGLPGLPGGPVGVDLVAGSCATTPTIDDAVLLGDVVFVGTVLETENSGRWATVRVEERWHGARDLPDTVQVRGGPDPGTATSIDRTYANDRYLFVVARQAGTLVDNQCTGTTAWTDDLARLRPFDVSPAPNVVSGTPVSELNVDRILPVAALAGALVIAVVAYVVILRARRRPPDWMR